MAMPLSLILLLLMPIINSETIDSTDDDQSEGVVGSIVEQIDEIIEDIREKNEMFIEKGENERGGAALVGRIL